MCSCTGKETEKSCDPQVCLCLRSTGMSVTRFKQRENWVNRDTYQAVSAKVQFHPSLAQLGLQGGLKSSNPCHCYHSSRQIWFLQDDHFYCRYSLTFVGICIITFILESGFVLYMLLLESKVALSLQPWNRGAVSHKGVMNLSTYRAEQVT